MCRTLDCMVRCVAFYIAVTSLLQPLLRRLDVLMGSMWGCLFKRMVHIIHQNRSLKTFEFISSMVFGPKVEQKFASGNSVDFGRTSVGILLSELHPQEPSQINFLMLSATFTRVPDCFMDPNYHRVPVHLCQTSASFTVPEMSHAAGIWLKTEAWTQRSCLAAIEMLEKTKTWCRAKNENKKAKQYDDFS